MKFAQLILALTLAPWTMAFASVSSAPTFELYAKTDNVECTITGTTVTKKVSFFYGTAGFTTTKEVQPFGFEPIVQKAAASSRGIASHGGYLFLLKMDGINYGLNATDSNEALLLVSFLNQACSN